MSAPAQPFDQTSGTATHQSAGLSPVIRLRPAPARPSRRSRVDVRDGINPRPPACSCACRAAAIYPLTRIGEPLPLAETQQSGAEAGSFPQGAPWRASESMAISFPRSARRLLRSSPLGARPAQRSGSKAPSGCEAQTSPCLQRPALVGSADQPRRVAVSLRRWRRALTAGKLR